MVHMRVCVLGGGGGGGGLGAEDSIVVYSELENTFIYFFTIELVQ